VLIGRHAVERIPGRRSADNFIQSGGSIKQLLGEIFFSPLIARFLKKRQNFAAKYFSLYNRDIRGHDKVHAWHSLPDANEEVSITVYRTASCGAGTGSYVRAVSGRESAFMNPHTPFVDLTRHMTLPAGQGSDFRPARLFL